MPWILLDLALAGLALALLGAVSLRLWRRVKGLGRVLGVAGDQVAEVTAQLAEVGAPRGAVPPAVAPRRDQPGARRGRR